MQIVLSWDLLIILFVALVTAYSFIVGKDASMRIVVAAYIAVVAVQALGNLVQVLLGASTAAMVGLSLPTSALVIGKLVLFGAAIVFLSIRGGIEAKTGESFGTVWDIVLTTALGFSTAGLLLSSLVTFVAGGPLLDLALAQRDTLNGLPFSSPMVGIVIDYQHVWFALPAVLLVAIGFMNARNEA